MVDMARKEILPAVEAYLGDLSGTVAAKTAAVPGLACKYEKDLISKLSKLADEISDAASSLDTTLIRLKAIPDVTDAAYVIQDVVLQKITAELRWSATVKGVHHCRQILALPHLRRSPLWRAVSPVLIFAFLFFLLFLLFSEQAPESFPGACSTHGVTAI